MSIDKDESPSKGNILVVEDEIPVQEFISGMLTKKGYTVRVVGDGELALQSIQTEHPELILMDMNMPGMSGIDVCRKIKSDPETRNIPVIFLSALGEVDLKVKALEAGGTDYVTKPAGPSEILARISTHINMYRLQQRLKIQTEKLAAEIKERKQVEEDLLKERTLLKTIVDNIPVMLTRYNPDANMLYLNKEFEKKVGWNTEEVQDIDMMEKVYPDPDYRQQAMDFMLKANLEWREFTVMSKFGEPINSEWSNFRMEDGTQIGIGIDITERKQLEEQLRQTQKMESIGILAGGISHELNTPIQYIGDNTIFFKEAFQDMSECFQVLLEFFESGKKNEIDTSILERVQSTIETADIEYIQGEIPSAIEETLEGVKRIQKIVKAMKNFAHPGESVHVQTDLNECIQDTVTISKSEWESVSEMVLDLDSNLPMVNCDPGELNQVFLNLIVNASHAISANIGNDESNKGKIKITTKALKDWVEIMVSDTGTGVPEDLKYKIFDPFFSTKEIGKGTGQGLAITHSIVVDRHKGQIDVAASKNGGAVFLIKLPLNA